MSWEHCLVLAKKNLKGRKSKTVLQSTLLIIALFVILATNIITYGLDYFLTTYINRFYYARELIVSTSDYDEKVTGEIAKLFDGDEKVEAVGCRRTTSAETEDIRQEEALFFEMRNCDDTYKTYIMNGCRTPEKGEIIIPKYIFGEEVYESIGITSYIDGEEWIGKDIAFQCTTNTYMGEMQGGNVVGAEYESGQEEQVFHVIGVYDNVEYGEVECMGLVSEEDSIYLDGLTRQNEDKNAVQLSPYQYHVLLQDAKYAEEVMKKLADAGFSANPVLYEGESEYMPFVRFARFIGNLVGVLILLWACFQIIFYYRKEIIRRTGELGLMKAVGYTTEEISSIFFMEGVIMGVISLVAATVIGGIFAVAGNALIRHYLNPIWAKIHFYIHPLHFFVLCLLVAVMILCNHMLTRKKIQKLLPSEALKGE